MKNVLNKILQYKKTEIKKNKALYPQKLLEQSIYFETPVVSIKSFLSRKNASGIIAEFKRQSPSKGIINAHASVEEVSIGYMQAGASALSVLTDNHFFGGKNQDLSEARKYNYAPVLYKNFIIDEYQIIEAKSIGADVILLIAECLEIKEVEKLAKFAKSLGLEVLMELHSKEMLDKLTQDIDLVGVNNRNLDTFEVNINNSLAIAQSIPSDFMKISESGLNDPQTVTMLRNHGFDGFLIGEHFMKHARPQDACAKFIQEVRKKSNNIYEYEN